MALRACLKKFGIGKWVQIVDSGVLPGKQLQQLNGQDAASWGNSRWRSTRGCDWTSIGFEVDNDALTDVTRKNGLITNQGGIRSKEALSALRRRGKSLKKYGLSEEEVQALELPAPPRAAALGAQRYMGNANNAVAGDVETTVAVKGDAAAAAGRGARTRHRRSGMSKALRSRVEDRRARRQGGRHDERRAKTPAKGVRATPAKRTPKAKTAARGKKKAKPGDDSGDDGAYETIAVVESGGSLESLMKMGFSKKHCMDALDTCGGDVEESVEWLMTNSCQ